MSHNRSSDVVTGASHLRSCGWYWGGLPVGALAAFTLVVFPTLGLAWVFLIAVLMIFSPAARRSAFGLVTGAGLPLLLVAYLNRQGPGASCYRTAMSAGCDQHLNPIPWLVIGLVLLAVGFGAQARAPR